MENGPTLYINGPTLYIKGAGTVLTHEHPDYQPAEEKIGSYRFQ